MHIFKHRMEIIVQIVIGFGFALIGPTMIEMSILNKSLKSIIIGIPMGLLMTLMGVVALVKGIDILITMIKSRNNELQEILEEKEAAEGPLRAFLIRFREHYSDFFRAKYGQENAAIQWESTQLYRNILEFRKNRLEKLGITCEMIIHSMKNPEDLQLFINKYSDGKYDITEVQETIAAKTVYKKEAEIIHTRVDQDLACYTIVSPLRAGKGKIVCPNCGAEATREELLDGCDYCGTKFIIEDLQNRIAEFAFRPDYQVALGRYKRIRNRVLFYALLIIFSIIFVVFAGFSIMTMPELMADPELGVVSSITISILAVIIGSICVIPIVVLIYWWIFPLIVAMIGINAASKAVLKKLKFAPSNDYSFAETIREHDPNFSIFNFYSSLQNKISSVIFAETEAQLHAFADGNLLDLLGQYSDVVNAEAEYMGITHYGVADALQQVTVNVDLKLTRYKKGKCRYYKENWTMELVRDADCKTQVLYSPKVMTCEKCGASIDFLCGKKCSFCGNEIQLKNFDWVISKIKR